MSEPIEWEIANYLLPDNMSEQEYWDKNFPIIQTLSVTSAILLERKYFFKKNGFSRNDAITLIVFSDMAWQMIRFLSGKKGKDINWLNDLIPNGADDLYTEHKRIVDNINWVFEIHSAIRHPENDNINNYKFIYKDPWPEDIASKLLATVNSIDLIFSVFQFAFCEDSGWEDEIILKKKLADNARNKK